MTVLIGSDPEVMIQDSSTGRIISAAGMVGGTKDKPVPMHGLSEGFFVQEDNIMAEFNVPPTESPRQFAQNIRKAIDYLDNVVKCVDPAYGLDTESHRVLMHDQLTSAQAQEFGCSPDYDAYSEGSPADKVDMGALHTAEGQWRFGGGHIHLSWTPSGGEEVPLFVVAQLFDAMLGLSSIGMDAQGLRRGMYGQAGRYRPTSYGIEYRTLSNFWLWDRHTCHDVASRAYQLGRYLERTGADDIREDYTTIPWVDVQSAINREDADLASELSDFIMANTNLA